MRRALTHGTATALAMAGLLVAGTPAMAAEGGTPAPDVAAPVDSGVNVEYGAPFVLDEGEAADAEPELPSTEREISALYGAEPVEPETGETYASGEGGGQSGGVGTETGKGDAQGNSQGGEEIADEGAHEETHIGAIVGIAAGIVGIGAATAAALARRRGRHSDSPDDFDDLQETIID